MRDKDRDDSFSGAARELGESLIELWRVAVVPWATWLIERVCVPVVMWATWLIERVCVPVVMWIEPSQQKRKKKR